MFKECLFDKLRALQKQTMRETQPIFSRFGERFSFLFFSFLSTVVQGQNVELDNGSKKKKNESNNNNKSTDTLPWIPQRCASQTTSALVLSQVNRGHDRLCRTDI